MSAPCSPWLACPAERIEDSRSRPSLRKLTSSMFGDRLSEGVLRERDLVDPDFREPLAVAVQLAHALLRLVPEDEDLLVLGLAQHRAGDRGAAHDGGPDRDVVAVGGQDDAIEGHRGADFGFDEIGADDIAFRHTELLAAGL